MLNSDFELSKPWVTPASAVERVKSPCFRLRIDPRVAAALIARQQDLRVRNGTVIFYVDERIRILGYCVLPATSQRLGWVPVYTTDLKTIQKMRGVIECQLVGASVTSVDFGSLRTPSLKRYDVPGAGRII
jgi:hypothetical protein